MLRYGLINPLVNVSKYITLFIKYKINLFNLKYKQRIKQVWY